MKRAIILLVVAFATQVLAQDRVTVTVKNSELNNGVVIVNAFGTGEQAKVSMELHCNKGATACTAPAAGTYVMVKLPKNWGMYDCQNADLYPESADPNTDQKLGEYCLEEKGK
jgi:hypothetical protein